MKKNVSVVVANRLISFPNELLHVSLYFGCLMRWRYSSRLPVSLSRNAYARLQRNCKGKVRDAACCGVNRVV